MKSKYKLAFLVSCGIRFLKSHTFSLYKQIINAIMNLRKRFLKRIEGGNIDV